ncbi:MAG: cytochrome c biogenesis protein CcsA [Bacteroidales bacterium]
MTWLEFPYFAFSAIFLWFTGVLLALVRLRGGAVILRDVLLISGTLLPLAFVLLLWDSLERPPFRTLAETRVWYTVFITVIGLVIYYRWRLVWMLIYTMVMGAVFLIINYVNPDTFDKTLMPALQSPWFIPHVIVYIIGYAFLAASSLIGIKGLYQLYRGKSPDHTLWLADNVVYIGFAFLTFGLLFGALWAKEAWGHYWSWDPKETWAFITWLVYLLYIHFRINKKSAIRTALWVLALAFAVLLICWFGINYLPSARSSVHVYST